METPENDNLNDNLEAHAEDSHPLEAKVAELEEQLAATRDQGLRALAELDNLRKRTEKEKSDIGKYGISSFAKDLLEPLDNFSRALDNKPEADDETLKNFITGVAMTEKQLLDVLGKHGVKKITPLHEPFNPDQHQAMLEQPTHEHEAGTVLNVVQAGYSLHERLLRPAKVIVAKAANPEPIDETA